MSIPVPDFHRGGNILLDYFRLTDYIEGCLFESDNVIGSKDARIRQDGHAGKAETIADRRHVGGKIEVNHLFRRKRSQGDACADGAPLLEDPEIFRG